MQLENLNSPPVLLTEDNHLIQKNSFIPQIKVYKRRWVILLIFFLYSSANSFQWVEYSIITNIVVKFYKVSTVAVDWTSIIYMAIYPIIVLPASYIIDTQGLRITALIGGLGTALAAMVKVFSVRSDLFHLVLFAQAIGSTAQVFVLCLPAKIAAVWFKPNEVSLACCLGVFGAQFGFAMGFLVPTNLVVNSEDLTVIAAGFQKLCWLFAIYMLPVSLAIIFYFPALPPLPPSIAQSEERSRGQVKFKEFLKNFMKIFKNPGFLLQLTAYGINIGVYCGFSTFLNQFIVFHFKDAEKDAGQMGLFSVICGMIGSILFGIFLDKTHKYKETTLVVYCLSAVGMLWMAGALQIKSIILAYIACILIGLCCNCYMAIGFELAVELTFPTDESTTIGIMNAMTQAVGVFTTLALGTLNESIGPIMSLIFLGVCLLTGAILTYKVPNIKKRQEAFGRNKKDEETMMALN